MTSKSVAHVSNSVVVHAEDFFVLFKAAKVEAKALVEATLRFQHVAKAVENLARPWDLLALIILGALGLLE